MSPSGDDQTPKSFASSHGSWDLRRFGYKVLDAIQASRSGTSGYHKSIPSHPATVTSAHRRYIVHSGS